MTSGDPAQFVLADGDSTVIVREHATPNGVRLEIASSNGPTIRLDALELESLTWQEEGFLREHVAAAAPTASAPDADRTLRDAVRIANEYALVRVGVVGPAGAERLLVSSPKMGYRKVLTPGELAVLARQDASFFSELLETPLGPEPDDLVEFH